MSFPLKRIFVYGLAGLLGATVLGAGAFFALRLYTAPLQRGLLTDTQQLQGLARDLQDRVQAVDRGDFSALAALRRDDARIAAIAARWRGMVGGGWSPERWVVPVAGVRRILASWRATHGYLADLLAREQVLEGIGRAIAMLDRTATSLLSQSEKIVRDLVDNGGDDRDVYFASRQIVLIQRIAQHLHALLKPMPGDGPFTDSPAYKALVDDAALFEHTLEAMLKGGHGVGLGRSRDTAVKRDLSENGKMFVSINRDIGRILAMVPVLQDIQQTTRGLRASGRGLVDDGDKLADALVTYSAGGDRTFAAVYLAAMAALLLLLGYGLYNQRRFRARLDFSLAQNGRFRQTLADLRPALEGLARGEISDREIAAPTGMEGVVVPFNQATAQWRATLTAVKGWTAKLAPLAERVNAAAARIAQDTARQVEGTTGASATLNRLLPAADQSAARIGEIAQGVDILRGHGADARTRLQEAAGAVQRIRAHGETVSAVSRDEGSRTEGLVRQLDALANGIEELSVMILHLLVRVQDGEQAAHEPIPYANRALQVAHQCTEAVERLNEGLVQLAEDAQRRLAAAASLDEALSGSAAVTQAMEEQLGKMDAQGERMATLLRDATPALGELAAALLSVSDDLDGVHEYTMHASNEAADAMHTGKRIADLVDHIGRSIDKYNVMQ